MKPKPITKERILQITNDVMEEIINPATTAELRQCVRYWSMEAAGSAGDAARMAGTLAVCESRLKVIRDVIELWPATG